MNERQERETVYDPRQEWRELLFPRMTEDAKFADAYAQTITFALLLARNAGIAFEGRDLPAIGRQLGKQYALIGRALAVLADSAAADQLLVIETLRRIIGAVDWDQSRGCEHRRPCHLVRDVLAGIRSGIAASERLLLHTGPAGALDGRVHR